MLTTPRVQKKPRVDSAYFTFLTQFPESPINKKIAQTLYQPFKMIEHFNITHHKHNPTLMHRHFEFSAPFE